MIFYESPLRLPKGWTPSQSMARLLPSSFNIKTSVMDALRFLEDEIKMLGASKGVITSNYENLNSDRVRKKLIGSSGASIIVRIGSQEAHLACDKWADVQQNLYALHLALRNLRLMEEWGVAATYRMLTFFASDKAHTPMSGAANEMGLPAWMQTLGLGPTATLEDANAVYRRRAKGLTDDSEALLTLNTAIDEARKNLQ